AVCGGLRRGVTGRAVAVAAGASGGVWVIGKGSSLPLGPPAGSPPPLIVSTGMASQLQLEPGASLQIRVTLPGVASALPAIDCRIVGIGHYTFESSYEYTVATTMEGFAAVHGAEDRDSADLVLVASRSDSGPSAAAAAIALLRTDLRVYSNDQVLEQFNQNAFSYFRQISAILSSMTLAFAFLLVATLLTMSV